MATGRVGIANHLTRPVLLVALSLASCAATPGTQSGRWIGTLTPTTPGPRCSPSRGVADIRHDRLTFTPDEGTWILSGAALLDGTLSAEHTRPGADKRPYLTRLSATWTPAAISGTYTTPNCTFTVQLTRSA